MTPLAEDAWEERFRTSTDENGDGNLLRNDADIRMLLRRIGTQFVWSLQGAGGNEIVPGITSQAFGFFLCDVARTPEDEAIVAVLDEEDE
jgi:hypothetical protein